MLQELALYLKPDYTVVSLDFQTMSSSDFQSECSFVNGLAREIEKKDPAYEGDSFKNSAEICSIFPGDES